MNIKLSIFLLAFLLMGCGQRSMQELIVGRWKITKTDFSNATDGQGGLWNSYYEGYHGSIIEYKKDGTMKWDEQENRKTYFINPKDSNICYPNDTVKLLSISRKTLVVQETQKFGVLTTTLESVNSY